MSYPNPKSPNLNHPNFDCSSADYPRADCNNGVQPPTANDPNRQDISTQLHREAKWAVGLAVIYLIFWVIFAYMSPDGRGFFSMPWWFELSCVYLPIAFVLAGFWVLSRVYRTVDLDTRSALRGTLTPSSPIMPITASQDDTTIHGTHSDTH